MSIVMAIMAHPDDAEFTCAGTLAKWIKGGREVHYVVCTSGNKGTKDPQMSPHLLAQIREEEQRAAAEVLGVKGLTFLRHEDGELEVSKAFREEVAMLIRRYHPEVIFTHDAWRPYQLHPDHRAVGITVTDAVVAARDHLFLPGLTSVGFEAHSVKEMYLWSSGSPDHHEDITQTLEVKIEALGKHRSQLESVPEWEKRIKDWAAELGKEKGFRYAEAFKRIVL